MTQQTETTVTVQKIEGAPDALLCVYPNEQAPQDCYIALDLRDGKLSADYNGEIGNGVPSDVYHGIVRRYPIPVLQPATVNALMEQIAPYAQTVLDHSEIVWNGSDHVARLDRAAQLAEDEIAGDGSPVWFNDTVEEEYSEGTVGIIYSEMESDVYWWGASDWLAGVMREVQQRIRGGESLDAIYDEYQGDGSDEDTPVVPDLMPYLEQIRNRVQEEEKD